MSGTGHKQKIIFNEAASHIVRLFSHNDICIDMCLNKNLIKNALSENVFIRVFK
jgi:hypothetical protein